MTDKPSLELNHCRLCKSKNLKLVIDLGKSPPPNALLSKSQLKKPEPIFPLKVNFCLNCNQVQLSHVVSPDIMFREYSYVSSTSPVMVEHFDNYAKSVVKNLKIEKGDLVVEIGSNDGTLLKSFRKLGTEILGIDPARNVAKQATKEGVPTLPEFFTVNLAKKIVKKYGKAKIISANNVFAHINDLDEVVKGVYELLDEDGAFTVEFPYLVDSIDENVFDTIYHEHLSYLSVTPLDKFFKNFGMEIFDVIRVPVQGGSIRISVKKQKGKHNRTKAVTKFLSLEKKKKLNKSETYIKFGKKVQKTKLSLNLILNKLKKQKKSIVGYGAPGRSTTLLNYFKIDNQILDYIVDDNPYKIGLFTPGTHIPIFNVPKIHETKPDYILILSWNYSLPIIAKLNDYQESGGKFIIPVPEPRIA